MWEKLEDNLYQTIKTFWFFIEKIYDEWVLYSCYGKTYGVFKTLSDAMNYFENMQ